jgi:hypothetical protein
VFDQLPEPIDLELDLAKRVLYWADRGDPPRGLWNMHDGMGILLP